MVKRSRSHLVTIRVSFDKPCSAGLARAHVRDNLMDQTFYPTSLRDDDPEKFVVRSVRTAPKPKRRSATASA